jgi:hypothetical protein
MLASFSVGDGIDIPDESQTFDFYATEYTVTSSTAPRLYVAQGASRVS